MQLYALASYSQCLFKLCDLLLAGQQVQGHPTGEDEKVSHRLLDDFSHFSPSFSFQEELKEGMVTYQRKEEEKETVLTEEVS